MIGLSSNAVVTVDALGAVVKPGILVARDRTVDLTNETGELVQVFVPACESGHLFSIKSGDTQKISLEGVPAGIHAFAVFSRKVGDFARGQSSPKIIIQ
jgi:hypothetical protein